MPMIIVLDCLAWVFFHLLAGYVAWRIPASAFAKDNPLFRLRPCEENGVFHRRFFFVHRWKRYLPEAGGFFPRGFSKRHLTSLNTDYLNVFIAETRRGEFSHWLSIVPAPFFFLWNVWFVGVCMIVYALLFNLPFIAINRFNRGRLIQAWSLACRRDLRRGSGIPDEATLSGSKDRGINAPCNASAR